MSEKFTVPRIKSPLRYPGGKTRALKQILPIIPKFKEFREPMVGGGSVLFAVKQIYPEGKFWMNDFNQELYLFWKFLKEQPDKIIQEVKRIKSEETEGKKLHKRLLDKNNILSEFERAVRFFVLNRMTFSGLAESGGYSEGAFNHRFTDSSIERLKEASKILKDTKITNEDYIKSLEEPGEEVFIFLDPPYLSKSKSRLYGKNGDLHEGFDHNRFLEAVKNCKHKWLITYDNSPEVKELFNLPGVFLYEWELQYGMNNYKQKTAAKGKELFISNYRIASLEKAQVI